MNHKNLAEFIYDIKNHGDDTGRETYIVVLKDGDPQFDNLNDLNDENIVLNIVDSAIGGFLIIDDVCSLLVRFSGVERQLLFPLKNIIEIRCFDARGSSLVMKVSKLFESTSKVFIDTTVGGFAEHMDESLGDSIKSDELTDSDIDKITGFLSDPSSGLEENMNKVLDKLEEDAIVNSEDENPVVDDLLVKSVRDVAENILHESGYEEVIKNLCGGETDPKPVTKEKSRSHLRVVK